MPEFAEAGLRVVILGAGKFSQESAKVQKDINDINAAARKAGDSGLSFAFSLQKIGSAIQGLGRALTLGVTVPILSANAAFTKAGVDFEDAFAGVLKTVDGLSLGFDDIATSMYGTADGLTEVQKQAVFSNEAFGDLTQAGQEMQDFIRGLALDIPLTATELSRIGEIAGQLGVRGTDNLQSFITSIAQISVATDLTSEDAAIGFAKLANVVGVSTDDMAEFVNEAGNAIVNLGNNMATTEPDILSIALRFAGFASAIGVTTPEILAIGASVLSAGIEIEAGGSSIAKIFQEMTFSVNDYSTSGDRAAATTTQIESDLARLEQLLSSGMSWDEIQLAMENTSLDLSGMASKVSDLGTALFTVDDIITKVSNNTRAKLVKALNDGTITSGEYEQAISNLSWELDNLRFTIANGERDVSAINYTFAGTGLVLSGLQSDLNKLDNGFTSTGDILDIVRQKSLSQMNKDLAEGQSQLELFAEATGLSTDAMAKLIEQEPDLAFFKIVEGLSRMQEEGKLSNDVLTDLGLNNIRLKTLVFNLGQNTELYNKALGFSNDGWERQVALQEEAEKKFNTTKAQIQLTKNAFNDLGISIFYLQKDSMDKMLKRIRDIIARFQELDDGTKRLIITIAGIASAAGPVLFVVGTMIKQVGKVTALFNTFARILFSQVLPVILSLAAPIAIITGAAYLLYKAWDSNFAGIQDIFDKLANVLRLTKVLDPFKEMIDALKSGDFSGAWEALKEGVERVFNFLKSPEMRTFLGVLLKELIDNLGDEFNKALERIDRAFHNLPSTLTQALFPVIMRVFGPELGREIIKALRTGLSDVIEVLDAVFEPLITGITRTFEFLSRGEYKKAWTAFKKIFVHIFDRLKDTDLVQNLSRRVEELYHKVMREVDKGLKGAPQLISSASDTISDFMFSAFSLAGQTLLNASNTLFGEEFTSGLINSITGIFDTISPYIPAIIDPLVAGISDLGKGIAGFAVAISDVDLTVFAALAGFLIVLASNVVGLTLSAIGAVLPGIGESLESIITALSKLIEGDTKAAMDEVTQAIGGLWDTISNFDTVITDRLADVLNKLAKALGFGSVDTDKLDRISSFLVTLGEAIVIAFAVSKLAAAISAVSAAAGGFSVSTFLLGVSSVVTPVLLLTGAILSLKNNTFGVNNKFSEFANNLKNLKLAESLYSLRDAFGLLALGIATNLAQIILDLLGFNVDVEARLTDLYNNTAALWDGIKVYTSFKWKEIKDEVKEQIDKIKDYVSDLPNNLKNSISKGYNQLKEAGKSMASGILDGFKSIVRFIIDILNDAIPDSIGIGIASVGLPKNPISYPEGYAEGGRIGGPAIVGERGPELFWPDSAGFIGSNDMLRSLLFDLLNPLNLGGNNSTSIDNSRTFAPVITGAPIQNERDLGAELTRLYWMTQ